MAVAQFVDDIERLAFGHRSEAIFAVILIVVRISPDGNVLLQNFTHADLIRPLRQFLVRGGLF